MANLHHESVFNNLGPLFAWAANRPSERHQHPYAARWLQRRYPGMTPATAALLAAEAGFTVTVIELLVNAVVPPVALMVAFCASYKVIKPPEVDTPLLKVITSEAPKLTAVVALLLTVGL